MTDQEVMDALAAALPRGCMMTVDWMTSAPFTRLTVGRPSQGAVPSIYYFAQPVSRADLRAGIDAIRERFETDGDRVRRAVMEARSAG